MTKKTILVTGASDGIGRETAGMLVSRGHHVLLHGRNMDKLEEVKNSLSGLAEGRSVEIYMADLSSLADVEVLSSSIAARHDTLDVLINNAGVYSASELITRDGLDVRFAVNTIAPYLLTTRLLPLLAGAGRVINLSSAAQSRVNLDALVGGIRLSDGAAYAQSKLALTMWSRTMGLLYAADGPSIVAVNPGSMLGSKMVKEAFGVDGGDLRIGADILCRAALSEGFADASGRYFDNDRGIFSSPHPDALDADMCNEVVRRIKEIIKGIQE